MRLNNTVSLYLNIFLPLKDKNDVKYVDYNVSFESSCVILNFFAQCFLSGFLYTSSRVYFYEGP
jgi:hypothetical protein